jgi:peptidoglycan/LPS O-acetylase OafA/YrhL
MGSLRFALAIAVLLSHAGLTIWGLNPGVISVVVFYIISGYVMAALIGRYYSTLSRVHYFYLDRVARIYPQYAVYAGGAALWFFSVGQPNYFLSHAPALVDWLNNLLVVPLNYFMYNGSDRFTLVPPAWSLGVELFFYALAPLLWRYWTIALWAAIFSLVVQALAWHGVLQTDWWGYRLLPGVLWIFLLGMAIHRLQNSPSKRLRQLLFMAPLFVAVVWVYLSSAGKLMQPYHREVLLGIALGVPMIQWLSLAKSPWTRVDQHLGDLSYGIFLNHFLLIWLLELSQPQGLQQWAALIFGSIALSALTQRFIEKPVIDWRRRWRRR